MNKMLSFDQYLKEQLKDAGFKKEWNKLEPQYQVLGEVIKARLDSGISQRELAKKAGTTQAVISRIESMSVSPTVRVLQKVAGAMGKKLQIKFV